MVIFHRKLLVYQMVAGFLIRRHYMRMAELSLTARKLPEVPGVPQMCLEHLW